MSLLTAQNLVKFYGPEEIFRDISVDVPHGARIALVGPNGAGKTTLLNLLVGLDAPSEGQIFVAKSAQIGFLPQRPELAGDHTLWEEALGAFAELREMEVQMSQLEHDMADPQSYEKALEVYGPLQAEFERLGGYTYENRIKMVLDGVGFKPEDYSMRLPQLSGGQKTRALLARLLLSEPTLLVMDEPTNHLDIQAVEWLEGYLKNFPGAVLAVSHDRYFMDNFATVTWELDYGTLEAYRGNYSHYVRQRGERQDRLLKEYEQQQEFITKEQEFIRKHMGSRLTAQAKGRLKKLETMRKRGKIINRPRGERKDMSLRLESAMRSGDKVLTTHNLSVGYDQPLFRVPDITLWRGETAALIGPNGVGKSTFLKTIVEVLRPLSGSVTIGASVKLGYFAQAHESLDPSKTLVDEITDYQPMPVSEARSYLGKYLFSGDDVFRAVATLSGGERGRLALAKLSLSGANLLLLDEPTNHLDIDSQEILQEVLAEFDGTILLVSHDRYLIDALASQIWYAQPGAMQVFEGTYQEFVATRNNFSSVATSNGKSNGSSAGNRALVTAEKSKPKHGLNPFQLKKRLDEVEGKIHRLEAQLAQIESDLTEVSANGDAQQAAELGAAHIDIAAQLDALMEEWGLLAE